MKPDYWWDQLKKPRLGFIDLTMWFPNDTGTLSGPSERFDTTPNTLIYTTEGNIRSPGQSPDPTIHGLHMFFTIVTSILIFIGNTLIITAILCAHALHCPQGALLLSVAFADLIIGIESLLAFIAIVTGEWPTSPIGCTIMGYATEVAIAVNMFTISLMSVDRWLVVHKPFRYSHYVTLKRVMGMIVAIWLLSFALYCPFFFSCLEFEFEWQTFMCSLEIKRCQALVLTIVTFVKVPALVVMVTFTMMTCRTAQMHIRSIQAVEMASNRAREPSQELVSFSHSKHVRTTLVVILTFLVTSLPMYILQMCSTINPTLKVPDALIFVSNWLLFSNSYLNCVICLVTNTNFRDGLHRLLRQVRPCCCRTSGNDCVCTCTCSVYVGRRRQRNTELENLTIAHILIKSLHKGGTDLDSPNADHCSGCTEVGYVNPALDLHE